MGLHHGIAAIPKLLGSDVREKGQVDDLGSGIREAGKGLFYGWWDGITGLATEPWQGAQKEVSLSRTWGMPSLTSVGSYGFPQRSRSKLGQCRCSSRWW